MANFIKKKLFELGLLDEEEENDVLEEAENITKPRESKDLKDATPLPKRGKIVNIHTTTQIGRAHV